MSDTQNALQEFDPKALQEKVSSVTKNAMFTLMPDEQFEALVQKEIKAFFEEESKKVEITKQHSGYNQPNRFSVAATVTPFRAMVWSILVQEYSTKLAEFKESEQWKTGLTQVWEGNKQVWEGTLDEAMQKRFEAMSLNMAQSMFQNMMLSAVEQIKLQMVNNPAEFGMPGHNQY